MAYKKHLTNESKVDEDEVRWNVKLRKENEKKRTVRRKLQRKIKRGDNRHA